MESTERHSERVEQLVRDYLSEEQRQVWFEAEDDRLNAHVYLSEFPPLKVTFGTHYEIGGEQVVHEDDPYKDGGVVIAEGEIVQMDVTLQEVETIEDAPGVLGTIYKFE